jgi:hypothetical protein
MTCFSYAPGIAVAATVFVGLFAPSTLAANTNSLQRQPFSLSETVLNPVELTTANTAQETKSSSQDPPVNGGPGNTQGSGTR